MAKAKRAQRVKTVRPVKRAKSVKATRSIMKRGKSEEMVKRGIRGQKEIRHFVVSPRGRALDVKGMYDPQGKIAKGMPLSKQDYFLLSRSIRYMGYDRRRSILEIHFIGGSKYQFLKVPEVVWEALQMAQSKGKYFHEHIYGYWSGKEGAKVYHPVYSYRKVG